MLGYETTISDFPTLSGLILGVRQCCVIRLITGMFDTDPHLRISHVEHVCVVAVSAVVRAHRSTLETMAFLWLPQRNAELCTSHTM